ncbi:hypothetical protein HDU93_007923 [Gonapodya sp. JEL0774]|nr:hypothetical protein HDU93_007923 [Gonapodya sp. JEL0774]
MVSEAITGMNVALGTLANVISKIRFGKLQQVSVDVDHASASLSTHCNMWLDGVHSDSKLVRDAATAQPNPHTGFLQLFQNTFRARDGWVYMYQRATDTPEGLLEAVGFPKEDVPRIYQLTEGSSANRREFLRLLSEKIMSWPSALDLEQHMIKLGRGAVIVPKSDKEFRESEHGKIALTFPVVEVQQQSRVGSHWFPAPFEPVNWQDGGKARGPLSGIKVIEITRILMGPQMACVLGGLGASVIRLSSPQLEDNKFVAMCLNVGKRSVYLDLKSEEGKKVLTELLAEADVVLQNNAYGAMDRLGFGMQGIMDIVKDRKKGIVYVQGNCFGFSGPYATAAGYEHLAQFFSGIATEQGQYAKYVPVSHIIISFGVNSYIRYAI